MPPKKSPSTTSSKAPTGLKIQFASDLHLEFRPSNVRLLTAAGDVLILAGDICVATSDEALRPFVDFLKVYAKHYTHVIHVAGNHEFYCFSERPTKDATIQETVKRLKGLSRTFPNYHFLNNEVFSFMHHGVGYNIVGTTLWTFVPPDKQEEVAGAMNDYRYIYFNAKTGCRKYLIQDMQRFHRSAVAFIEKMKQVLNPRQKNILVTHHKPVRDSADAHYGYETDLARLMGSPFKLAIHGHTHQHYDRMVRHTRVMSNPRGYPREPTGFVKDIVVEL